MYVIATLEQLRAHLGAPLDAAEDARMLRALEAAAVQIERLTGRRFLPYAATRRYARLAADELLLDEDLLELEALEDGGGAIALADVRLLPTTPPHSVLRLRNGARFAAGDDPHDAIAVTGIWGWCERWGQAWVESGETLSGALSATATTLSVSAIDGAAADGQSPRFQVGALLRVDEEYMRIVAVDTAAQSLTLERGAQGSVAAAHNAGAPLTLFRPDAAAADLALRWAAWLYRQPDSAQNDLDAALLQALYSLRRVGVMA